MLAVPAKRTASELRCHTRNKSPCKMDAILEEECSILRGKQFYRYHVILTEAKLVCRPRKCKRNKNLSEFSISLKDVLVAQHLSELPEIKQKARCIPCKCCKSNPSVITGGSALESDSEFVKVICFPYNKPIQDKGMRKKEEIIFLFESSGTSGDGLKRAKNLIKKINKLTSSSVTTPTCNGGGDAPDSSPAHHQRKFLVCINPFSGPGHAKQIYARDVKPVFQAAGIVLEELYTKRANHVKEVATQVDISKYDAVVIVSGDGLVFEWLNGIMIRPDYDEALSLPMGIIPAGSGNALASAMLVARNEQSFKGAPVHSALMTAKGRPTPMDVVEIHYQDQVVYSFLAFAWGIISDIDIESEWMRFIGSTRFTIQAILRILNLRKYQGRLSYLPAEDYQPSGAADGTPSPSTPNGAAKGNNLQNNSKASQAGDGIVNPTFRRGSQESSGSQPSGQNDDPSSDHAADGDSGDSIVLPGLSEPVPSDWVTIEGKFVSIVVMQDSHLSRDIVAWPGRTFDEGVMCIQYVPFPTSKLRLLEIMGDMADGSHMGGDSVEVIYAKAFRIEPITSSGVMTVDGERIEVGPIQGKMMDVKANILLP